MKFHLRQLYISVFAVVNLIAFDNCGGNGFQTLKNDSELMRAGTSFPLPVVGNESNVMPVEVGCGKINQTCVSVTICTPGTSTCQTIPRILLDTGSYGLRVFSSVVTVGLTSSSVGGGALAECVSYADGSSDWGPVKTADIGLGRELAPNVPIQIIDSTFGTIPSDCTKPDASPSSAGFNGILGIGLFIEDCGSGCTTIANNKIYYSCTGSACSPTIVPLAKQVSNPITFLPVDNNGSILQLPGVPETGATSAPGYFILGIGTQKNNTPTTAHVLHTDEIAMITTDFNGKSYPAFIDSGSNSLFFPSAPGLPMCNASGGLSRFYCPSSTLALTAAQGPSGSAGAIIVDFQVANAAVAFSPSNPNSVFNNLAGQFVDSFDWGLPFFLGRTVYNGINGKSSPLGVGPYYAY